MTNAKRKALMALLLLAAFAMCGDVAFARERAPIRTIGIVSDVGDTVRLKHIGFMVFSNSEDQKDFPEWQLDAFIAGELEAALKGAYELRGVTFAKGSVAPDLTPKLFSGPRPEKNVQANVRPSDGQPIDAYIVVWPYRMDVYPTNQYVTGVGLLTQGGYAALYTRVMVTLVDGRTFEEIDSCALRAGDPSSDIDHMRKRDDLKRVERFDAMTPEQLQSLEQGLKDMVRDGLSYCLRDLKLAP